tara:strand:- start:1832 stop:4183 length:2352 start_codon:yes stop_codon:yes gene_type:complete
MPGQYKDGGVKEDKDQVALNVYYPEVEVTGNRLEPAISGGDISEVTTEPKKTLLDKIKNVGLNYINPLLIADNTLQALSIPSNIIRESIEGIGGKGDAKFNWKDIIPDVYNTTIFDEDKKQEPVSKTLGVEGFFPSLLVDLATDPTTYVGAGVVKNLVQKSGKTILPKVGKQVKKIKPGYKSQSPTTTTTTTKPTTAKVDKPKNDIVTKENIITPTAKEDKLINEALDNSSNFYQKQFEGAVNQKKLDEMGPYGDQIRLNYKTSLDLGTFGSQTRSGLGSDISQMGYSTTLDINKIGQRRAVDFDGDLKFLDYDAPNPRVSFVNKSQSLMGYRQKSKFSVGKNIGGKIKTQADVDDNFVKSLGETDIHETSHNLGMPTNFKAYYRPSKGENAGKIVSYNLHPNNMFTLHRNKNLVFDPRQPAIRYGEGIATKVTDEGVTFTTKWNPKKEQFDTEFVKKSDLPVDQYNLLNTMKNKPSSQKRFKNFFEYKRQPLEIVPNMQAFKYQGKYTDDLYGNIGSGTADKLYGKLKNSDRTQWALFRDSKAFQNIFNKSTYGAVPVGGIGGATIFNNKETSTGYRKGGFKKENGGFKISLTKEGFRPIDDQFFSRYRYYKGKSCEETDSACSYRPNTTIGFNAGDRSLFASYTPEIEVPLGGDRIRTGGGILALGTNFEGTLDKDLNIDSSITGTGRIGWNRYERRQENQGLINPFTGKRMDKVRPQVEAGIYGNYDLQNKNIKDVGLYGRYGALSGNLGYDLTDKQVKAGIGLKFKEGGKKRKCRYGCW